MATKFYFHDAASADTGTLPSAWLSTNYHVPPDVTATGASTNRSMDTTIGALQVSIALTTLAQTAVQHNWFRRFLSSPLAAQNIASQSVNLSVGASEANIASNMFPVPLMFLWRPSTGALVGPIMDVGFPGGTEPGTAESSYTATGTSQVIDALDGDIIVLDLIATNNQGGATARVNTQFYDGTTEASTTTNAAFLSFANTITFSTGAAAQVPRRRPMDQMLSHMKKFTFLEGIWRPENKLWTPDRKLVLAT